MTKFITPSKIHLNQLLINGREKVAAKKLKNPKTEHCRGAVVITIAQLHSTKPELRFCAGSDPAHGVLEIHDDEDL